MSYSWALCTIVMTIWPTLATVLNADSAIQFEYFIWLPILSCKQIKSSVECGLNARFVTEVTKYKVSVQAAYWVATTWIQRHCEVWDVEVLEHVTTKWQSGTHKQTNKQTHINKHTYKHTNTHTHKHTCTYTNHTRTQNKCTQTSTSTNT